MIFVGLDDTDAAGTAGTNQLARSIASRCPRGFQLRAVLRHQLLTDHGCPAPPATGRPRWVLHNGPGRSVVDLLPLLRVQLSEWPAPGSDPGLCVAAGVPPAVITASARRCRRELVSQDEARILAARHGLHLEDFGGTGDGVIGALAAVGLGAEGQDGRVVHLPNGAGPTHSAESTTRRPYRSAESRTSGCWTRARP